MPSTDQTYRPAMFSLPDVMNEDFLETIATCRSKAQDPDFQLSVDANLILGFGNTALSFSQARQSLYVERSTSSLPLDMRGLAALSDYYRNELPLNQWTETLDEPYCKIASAVQALQANSDPTFDDVIQSAVDIYEALGTLHQRFSEYRDEQGYAHPFCAEAALTIEKEILQSFGTDLTADCQRDLDLARSEATLKLVQRTWDRLSAQHQIRARAPLALWVALSALQMSRATSGTFYHPPGDVL